MVRPQSPWSLGLLRLGVRAIGMLVGLSGYPTFSINVAAHLHASGGRDADHPSPMSQLIYHCGGQGTVSQKALSSQNPLDPYVGDGRRKGLLGLSRPNTTATGFTLKLAQSMGSARTPSGGSTGTKQAPDTGPSAAARLPT